MKYLLTVLLFCHISQVAGNTAVDTLHLNLSKIENPQIKKVLLSYGDNEIWANLNYNDSLWDEALLDTLNTKKKDIFWIRKYIVLYGELSDTDILAISFLNLGSACEVYWDGKLIGKNGTVGKNIDSEISGYVGSKYLIGKSLSSPGLHILSIRISSFSTINDRYFAAIRIGYNSVVQPTLPKRLEEQIVYLSIFITAAVFSMSLFLGGWRHKSFIVFSIFIILSAISSFWLYLLYGRKIDVNFFRIIDSFYFLFSIISFVVYDLFILYYFEIKKKRFHVIVLLFSSILLFYILAPYPEEIRYSIIVGLLLCYAMFFAINGMRRRAAGSYLISLGQLIAIVNSIVYIFGVSLPFSFNQFAFNMITNIAFTGFCIMAISRKIKVQTKLYQEMLMKSQRLETELLKKSIQPHFITNTLLSLKSLIATDSDTAEKMIDALSDEYHIINQISSEKNIPIEKELELCRNHLEVMGYRYGAKYELKTGNICKGSVIPPMIFHTLIENGLTHSFESKESGYFNIECNMEDGKIKYKVVNNGSRLGKLALQSNKITEDGMGFRYIKSRLEESYPGNWKIEYGLKNSEWEVIIELKV